MWSLLFVILSLVDTMDKIILRLAVIEKTDTGVEHAVRTTAIQFLPEVTHFKISLLPTFI